MSLNINPIAKLVTSVNSAIVATQEVARANLPSASSSITKEELDAKISRLSGELGSGLNQASSGFEGFKSALGNPISSPLGNTSLSSASDTIGALQSAASGAASALNNLGGDITSTLSKLTGGNLATGIQAFAGKISTAAGILNDIVSIKRGANIPKGGELFTTTGESIQLNASTKDDWRVRLKTNWSIFNSDMFNLLRDTGGVVFPYLPEVSLATKANYTQIDPTHNNYPFQAYKNSQVDEISINGVFTAESEAEAAYWIAATTFFRTVTKMFFGTGINAGNPPPICFLSGYGASVFDNVPVVVKSFSVDFPTDVNYIKCDKFKTSTWVPIKSSISITVQPVYNRRNLRQFSLENFARGKMQSPSGSGYL